MTGKARVITRGPLVTHDYGISNNTWSITNASSADLAFTSGPWALGCFTHLGTAATTTGQNPFCAARASYSSETVNAGIGLYASGGASPVWGAFVFANNGTANYTLLGTSAANVGSVFLGQTSDGTSTRRLFVNGIQENSIGLNLNPTTTAAAFTPFVAAPGAFDGSYLILAWNRDVAPWEWAWLNSEPYCFMRPRAPFGAGLTLSAFTASISDTVATSDSFTETGQTATGTVSDTVATSDSYTPTFQQTASVSDTVATSDAYTITADSLSISDSVATSDSYTPSTFAPTASVTDTVATSDAYTPSTFAPTASVSDSVATSDSLTPTFAPTVSVTDTVATSDTYTVTAASLSIADTVATSDSFTGTGVATGSLSDTVATSDSYTGAGAATASISDTVATSDSFTSSPIGLALTDSVATSDSYTAATFAATVSISDTVATSDAYTPTFAPTVSTSDSVTTSDSYTPSTFAPTASLSDTVATSDSFTEMGAFTATLSDTVATSDSFFIVSILVSDTVATDDSYTVTGFTATAEIDDTLTVSDSFTVIPPATTATTVTGPSDGFWDADEQRRRWIEWSRQRKQRQDQKPVAKAKLADIRIEPQREIPAAPAIAPAPQPIATDAIVQSLLQANAAAVRAQRESDAVIRANALALAEQLRIAQEEDDDDALALLMDD